MREEKIKWTIPSVKTSTINDLEGFVEEKKSLREKPVRRKIRTKKVLQIKNKIKLMRKSIVNHCN